MKKSIFFVLMGTALMFASCKSSKSAYEQAYEKAKGQETDVAQVNAPMQVTPVSDVQPMADANTSNVAVRQEQVQAITPGDLKAYSVVCGSFGVQAYAQNLCDYLQSQGYKAGIVKNVQKNMFRVIVGSWNTKAEAVSAREAFKAKFPGRSDFQESWILWNK